MRKETRVFEFPNGGHSVRKLCESLDELGGIRVELKIVNIPNQYDNGFTQQMSFIEVEKEFDYGQATAKKLSKKLRKIGTRFRVVGTSVDNYFKLEFDTDFTDIMTYPKFYGVL